MVMESGRRSPKTFSPRRDCVTASTSRHFSALFPQFLFFPLLVTREKKVMFLGQDASMGSAGIGRLPRDGSGPQVTLVSCVCVCVCANSGSEQGRLSNKNPEAFIADIKDTLYNKRVIGRPVRVLLHSLLQLQIQ
jgi:hypothetical protein